ncbi:MAG: hypothetical protein H5T86_13685, partial [Armatimonadetes bacterium]|nr:hypothetical protein [Armatimonadota bacterium]
MRNFHTVALVTLVLLAAPRTGAADKAPLAYWPLDEGQGNVSRDASGHGHDLQLSGTSWEKGAVGSCLRLHGAKSTASTPLTSDLLPSHVTVAAWVKVERLPDNSEGIGIVNAQSSYL